MNRVLCFILFLSASPFINAQEQLDSVFFRNGNTYAVNVIRSDNESIEYMYPNETVINETYKTQLLRIKYRSGRIEECSELLKIKKITNPSHWEDVVVTYLIDDTKGLEKVSELSYVSGWGGAWAAGMGYNKAIQGLQKKAAKLGCGLLIHGSPNMTNTKFGAGTRVNATAYKIPDAYESEAELDNSEALTSTGMKSAIEDSVHCTPDKDTVNNPYVKTAIDKMAIIKRVIRKDDFTAVEISINRDKRQWCNIDEDTYIEADGIRYTMTCADGIATAPEKTYFSDTEDTVTFTLFFPPIPKSAASVHLIESTYSDFRFYGIQLR